MLELSAIGLLSALAAGVVSFLSPCVLPLVPGYLSYVAGQSIDDLRARRSRRQHLAVLILSLSFVLGFSSVFVALGASATAVGSWLSAYRQEANLLAGGVVIVFGLFMLGVLRFDWLQRDLRFHRQGTGGHPVSSYLLGVAFAFGWTPCIGPILGAILTMGATQDNVASGMVLLAVYSIGLGLPFVAAAVFTERFLEHARWLRQAGPWLHRGAGVMLVLMGLAMITGLLQVFSVWLLEALPWLARIG